MEYDLFETASGNAVVAALDHGLSAGALEGFRDPAATLSAVLAGDPDGVLVGPHFARRFADRLDGAGVDVCVTADVVSFATTPGADHGEEVWTRPFDVEGLLELDPAGVKAVLVFGRDDERLYERNVAAIGRLADDLRGTGVPLIVEPVMWGPRVGEERETDHDLVESACRMAWEYGADVLKAPYTGDPAAFADLVDAAPVPVTILGGPADGSTRAILSDVAAAVEAGARGPVIGRSIWQTEDPAAVVRAMREIVHDGASVDEAWG